MGEPEALRIQLLGDFRLWVGDKAIDPDQWRLRKARTLVKLLALASEHQLHREQLMALLWPDHEPDAAANNLHQALHVARRALEPDTNAAHYLQFRDETLNLCPDAPLWIDAEAFETAAREARIRDDPDKYHAALDLYTGDLLPDDRYEEWASARRESLQREHLRLLLELAQLYEGRSEYAPAIETLQHVLASDPAHEEAHLGLMRLYALSGQRQQALRQYQNLQDALKRELEAEPDPQSTRLYQEILGNRFPPPSAQVEVKAILPLVQTPAPPRNNLPAPLTSFIGREKEIAEVKQDLTPSPGPSPSPEPAAQERGRGGRQAGEGVRLLTLTGAGGSGKTRLSLEVARSLLTAFPDGVWFVELAPLSDPALVPQTIVTTLGLIEQAGRSPQTVLSDFLQSKQALLILDNCEHLIQACAQLAETLLRACPKLHLLATSREALSVPGEVTFGVPTLSIPDIRQSLTTDRLTDYEAVQLFVERAQTALSGFKLTNDNAPAVAQVCRHLDGIPLAIELAAARMKMLRVEEIALHLDDRFRLLTGGARTALPRHQTLQALIDWSYDLLSEPERVLLQRLSVFAGGWSMEAAESVCGGEAIETHAVLDLLTQLLNKSLVIAERKQGQETRYRMLETIRQYAREKLWAAGEGEQMRARHLAYFVELAERAEPNLRAFDMVAWLDRLEAEHDNIRVALEWALESDIEAKLRLASALWWFWHIRGYKNEGCEWLERALSIEALERGDQPLSPARAPSRGKALYVASFLSGMLWGLVPKVVALAEESLAIFRELGPAGKRGMAYALLYLAGVRVKQEGYGQAQAPVEESLALFREVGDKFGMAECLMNLCGIAMESGDVERGQTLTEEHLALRKEIGDKDGIAIALKGLGDTALLQGDHEQATAMYEESLALFREIGHQWAMSLALSSLGEAAWTRGDYGQATRQYEEALALGRELGDKWQSARMRYRLAEMARAQGDYEQAARQYAEALAVGQEVGNQEVIAGILYGLGEIALAQSDYEAAARQFEEVLTLGRESRGKPTIALALSGLGKVAQAKGDYATARALQAQVLTIHREMGDRREITHSLVSLAALAAAQQQAAHSPRRFENLQRAARLIGAAEAEALPRLKQRTWISFERERANPERVMSDLRAQLGEATFAAAWEEGKAMTMEQAVEYALAADVATDG